MLEVACFWSEPSDTAIESLRRYVLYNTDPARKCPLPTGYHTAVVDIGVVPWTDESSDGLGSGPSEELKQDSRWPTLCDCGYTFMPTDVWQHNFDRHYIRPDTGEKFLLRQAKPGAMWNAHWMGNWAGADGICLMVRLPPGNGHGDDWLVDGPAANAPGKMPGWDRTGTVPKVTATPSIMTSRYHGFLTDGVLRSR